LSLEEFDSFFHKYKDAGGISDDEFNDLMALYEDKIAKVES